MDAGDLDQRLYVRSQVKTSNGIGGGSAVDSWSTRVWAKVEPVRGQERAIADAQTGVQTYRITVRNNDIGKSLTTASVLRWHGVEMNVISAPDAGRMNYRTIEAQTGKPAG